MSTGFEKIGSDSGLQDHWIRRLVAFIIDAIIIGIGTFVIAFIIFIPFLILAASTGLPWVLFNPWAFPFFSGIITVLYSSLLESLYGWTFGKKIMSLKTLEVNKQKPPLDKAFIRNMSKIYWILVLIDVIIGLATLGDPYQKISDRFAGTTVTSSKTTSTTSPPPAPPPDQ